jgi:hypothetical protein
MRKGIEPLIVFELIRSNVACNLSPFIYLLSNLNKVKGDQLLTMRKIGTSPLIPLLVGERHLGFLKIVHKYSPSLLKRGGQARKELLHRGEFRDAIFGQDLTPNPSPKRRGDLIRRIIFIHRSKLHVKPQIVSWCGQRSGCRCPFFIITDTPGHAPGYHRIKQSENQRC